MALTGFCRGLRYNIFVQVDRSCCKYVMVSNTYKIIQMHVISIHSALVSKKSHPTLKSNEKKPGDIYPGLSASPVDRARPQLAIPHSISGPRHHGSARQPQQGRQPDEGEEHDIGQSEDRRGG